MVRRSWLMGSKRPDPRRRRGFVRPGLEALEHRTLPATVTWINPAGGDWDTPSNWSDGSTNRLPGPNDDAVIDKTGITVTHGVNVTDTVHSITSQAALTLSGGTLDVAGTVQVSATFTLSSTLARATVAAGTTITATGGKLYGVTLNGNFNMTISGNYTQTADGTLNTDIGGPNAGSDYDQLVIGGSAVFDGMLNVSILNGYQPDPSIPDSFQILRFGQHDAGNDFAVYNGLDLGNGVSLTPVYDDVSLTLVATVNTAPLPGQRDWALPAALSRMADAPCRP